MRDLNELGIDVRGRDSRPRFSEELLHRLETLYNVQLPQSYVKFLRFANGGRPEVNVFDCSDGTSESAVSHFCHLDSQDWGPTGGYSIEATTDAVRELFTEEGESFYREISSGDLVLATTEHAVSNPDLAPSSFDAEAIAIGSDGGGNLLFMDVSEPGGKVYIYYYDGGLIVEVNDTFEGFIDSLHVYNGTGN